VTAGREKWHEKAKEDSRKQQVENKWNPEILSFRL
jgi:hypothetical protein